MFPCVCVYVCTLLPIRKDQSKNVEVLVQTDFRESKILRSNPFILQGTISTTCVKWNSTDLSRLGRSRTTKNENGEGELDLKRKTEERLRRIKNSKGFWDDKKSGLWYNEEDE